jgi:hypothetical protein
MSTVIDRVGRQGEISLSLATGPTLPQELVFGTILWGRHVVFPSMISQHSLRTCRDFLCVAKHLCPSRLFTILYK